MQTKFIHFGCWNQKFCDKREKIGNDNPISKVMRQLDETVQKAKETGTPHDFIVVAGDNYYPEKDKDKKKDKSEKSAKTEKSEKSEKAKIKGKTIIQANLESGFNCLPNDIEINIILGNHDLETTGNGKQLFIENTENPEEAGACNIIRLEEESVKKKKGYTLDLHKHKWLGDNTLVLMIDTSMYDEEDAESFLPCYNKKTGKDWTIAKYIEEQQEDVDRTIKKYTGKIENIIVIGHHPISGYKHKGEGIMVIKSFPGLIKLFLSIQTMLPLHVNYYYLCADLHSYQIGTININSNTDANEPIMKIKQYIVGTGGTELDPSPFEKMEKDPILTLPNEPCYRAQSLICSYEMTPEQFELSTSEKHGFLECELKGSKMHFKFIDTHGFEYREKNNSSRTRRASIGGRRRVKKKRTRKIRKYKKY